MTVCLDTNALLQMLSVTHRFRRILDAWVAGVFAWAISNEILTEYEELIRAKLGAAPWERILRALEIGERTHGNLLRVHPTFRFGIIAADPDDNKFADCAIVADADFIIAEDRHFRPLATAGYKVRAITPEEFIQRFLP